MSMVEIVMMVIGGAITIALSAFGLGHVKGKNKAQQEAEEQRTQEKIKQTTAAATARVQAAKEASNVQDNVTRLPDVDVDKRLRDKWRSPGRH